jgi:hypothetical protein
LLRVEGHYVVGVSQFWKGELVLAREHLEQALSYYPAGGARDHVSLYAQDPRVVCSSRLAVDLWLLGYPDDARKIMTNALRHAEQLSHPYSLCYALTWSVILAMLESNLELAQERNDASATVTREHRMDTFVGAQGVARGWLLAERGDALAGIRLMQEGIAAHRAASIAHQLPWFTGLVAEHYGKIGRPEEGLRLVADALDAVERTDERWSELSCIESRARSSKYTAKAPTPNVLFSGRLALRANSARAFEWRTLSSLSARQALRPAR